MRPMFPSFKRSSKGRPMFLYSLAIFDEAQVGFDEIVVRPILAGDISHAHGDLMLFFLREEGVLADLLKVFRHAGTSFKRTICHQARPSPWPPAWQRRVTSFSLDFVFVTPYIYVNFLWAQAPRRRPPLVTKASRDILDSRSTGAWEGSVASGCALRLDGFIKILTRRMVVAV